MSRATNYEPGTKRVDSFLPSRYRPFPAGRRVLRREMSAGYSSSCGQRSENFFKRTSARRRVIVRPCSNRVKVSPEPVT